MGALVEAGPCLGAINRQLYITPQGEDYLRAESLVEEFFSLHPDGIRRLREIAPSFKDFSPDLICSTLRRGVAACDRIASPSRCPCCPGREKGPAARPKRAAPRPQDHRTQKRVRYLRGARVAIHRAGTARRRGRNCASPPDLPGLGSARYFPKKFGLRISVYSNDHPPPHIHVHFLNGERSVRVGWPSLQPLGHDRGLSSTERRDLGDYVQQYETKISKRVRAVFADPAPSSIV